MNIRILLADDHKIIREGLKALIDRQSDMNVIGEAEDGRTTVRLAGELCPDIVIMDISMPDMNGIEATRQIVGHGPGVRIVALSVHSDKRFVAEMLNAGAAGYLLKDCAFEELVNAIHSVASNRSYLSPSITDLMLRDYRHILSKETLSVFSLLTAREREVLQLIAEGKSTKEIAHDLNVSVKTVETYRQQIMEKLDLHSIADLTKYAVKEGLTTL
ncbi:MAG: response regulator transcription factor [Nitrospirota bacterium]